MGSRRFIRIDRRSGGGGFFHIPSTPTVIQSLLKDSENSMRCSTLQIPLQCLPLSDVELKVGLGLKLETSRAAFEPQSLAFK